MRLLGIVLSCGLIRILWVITAAGWWCCYRTFLETHLIFQNKSVTPSNKKLAWVNKSIFDIPRSPKTTARVTFGGDKYKPRVELVATWKKKKTNLKSDMTFDRNGWWDTWCHQLDINSHLPIQSLLLAVNSHTSSKSKSSLPKSLSCHWPISVTGRFQEFVVVSDHWILSNSGRLPGTTIHWPFLNTHACSFIHMHTHARTSTVTLCTLANPLHMHITWQHTSDPHIKNTAERPHWWGADRRDSFLCVVHQSVQAEW